MLKLINPETGKQLRPDEVDFTENSMRILEVKTDREGIMSDPHHDRAMELGGRCGDLIVNNYNRPQAVIVAHKLAERIEPPERAYAFMLGVRNAMSPHIELTLERFTPEVVAS